MNYDGINKELIDKLNSLPKEQKEAVMKEVYQDITFKAFEDICNIASEPIIQTGYSKENFLKMGNKLRKMNCVGNKESEGIYTQDGLIRKATDYNDYLLINTDYLLKLYNYHLFWWQKLLIKLLRFKNKSRKTFEFLYKNEILKDLKSQQSEGFFKYKL